MDGFVESLSFEPGVKERHGEETTQLNMMGNLIGGESADS